MPLRARCAGGPPGIPRPASGRRARRPSSTPRHLAPAVGRLQVRRPAWPSHPRAPGYDGQLLGRAAIVHPLRLPLRPLRPPPPQPPPIALRRAPADDPPAASGRQGACRGGTCPRHYPPGDPSATAARLPSPPFPPSSALRPPPPIFPPAPPSTAPPAPSFPFPPPPAKADAGTRQRPDGIRTSASTPSSCTRPNPPKGLRKAVPHRTLRIGHAAQRSRVGHRRRRLPRL